MTSLRLDKWLWFARFAKTRSGAARLCAAGCVTIGGITVTKPNHPVRLGDAVAVRQSRALRRIVVTALGERRRPPAEARLLYAEPDPPLSLQEAERDVWTPLIEESSLDTA